MDELQSIYEESRTGITKDLKLAKDVIKEAREEVEESSGGNFYFTQINNEFNSISDEELNEMKLKTIKDLERLKKHGEIKDAEIEEETYAS